MASAGTVTVSPTVQRVVARIVDRFRPQRVILFGSHAAGTADAGSDIDVLVVMETPGSALEQAVEIYRSLEHDVPVDVLVRTPAQLSSHNPRDLILRSVLAEGLTLYEARD